MTRGNNGTTGDIVDSVSRLYKFKSNLPNYIFLFFSFFFQFLGPVSLNG